MNTTPAKHNLSDERLVRSCRKGDEAAWSALIDRYKNLIFSIPIKFGLSREDAAEVFQAVCVELFAGLPKLREPKALPKWLMQTSYHQCLRWKKERLHFSENAILDQQEADPEKLPERMLYQLQREQMVREAVIELSPRCQHLVKMLFFRATPRPYEEVAKELGLAIGSIGFIRGRCLKQLRDRLAKKGFR